MTDPVRERRQRVARWTQLANRLGYLCFGVAIVTFLVGFIVSFNATVSAIVVTSMIVGSVLLAPAIVLGYAVKAAERDDLKIVSVDADEEQDLVAQYGVLGLVTAYAKPSVGTSSMPALIIVQLRPPNLPTARV